MYVLIVTNNDSESIPQHNKESSTPPISEESEIDDSVADPDDEIKIVPNSEDLDRTKTLSDDDANNSGNQSPSVLDLDHYPHFDISVNELCRTSTLVVEPTQTNPLNNIEVNNDNSHTKTEILNNNNENNHQQQGIAEENKKYSKSEIKQLQVKTRNINKLKSKHPISLSICANCTNNCNSKFTEVDRRYIWNVYWNLDYSARRKWLASCVKSKSVQRRRVRNSGGIYRKKETRIYILPKDGKDEKVCLSFFLKTLGYSSDSVISELRKARQKSPLLHQVQENRGQKENSKKCYYSVR